MSKKKKQNKKYLSQKSILFIGIAIIVLIGIPLLVKSFISGNQQKRIVQQVKQENIVTPTVSSVIADRLMPTQMPVISYNVKPGWNRYFSNNTQNSVQYSIDFPTSWKLETYVARTNSVELRMTGDKGEEFWFSYLLEPDGLGGGPQHFTHYELVNVAGTQLLKGYMDSCSVEVGGSSAPDCSDQISSIVYDDRIDWDTQYHQIGGSGYPKINGVVSILNVSLPRAYSFSDPEFKNIDQTVNEIISSLQFVK